MDSNFFITGIFKSHRLGFGFVKPSEGPFEHEVFIPKTKASAAVEGDLVHVEVTGKDEKGYEGVIVKILKRKIMLIGGTVTESFEKYARVLCPLLGPTKEVEIKIPPKVALNRGDRIQIELSAHDGDKEGFKGVFKKYIGQIKDPSCDTEAAIYEFGLRQKFPLQVLDEVKNLPAEIRLEDYPDRENLCHLVCFTIDPETAKDYDDAISLEKTPDGNYELGVHIADVSYFVKEGTALDLEAAMRCNSTYFPDTCISMLPKELADHLCSLKPHVPRLAVSTLMTLNKQGELLDYRITRSIIESRQRFTYEEVRAILDSKEKNPFVKQLKELEKLALILKKVRSDRGCVDLALSDAKIMVNEKGEPYEIKLIEYDITHQMIEEFMLKNNEVIAKHLSDKKIAIPFRIHEKPKSDNIQSFVQTADSMGLKLSDSPTQKEIQALFEEVKGTALEHQLSVQFIKCMKLAIYSPDNAGHYGLQLDYYCHFTSPIRRYVDLVIHRAVFQNCSTAGVKEIAEKCSDQERLSAKAESSVRSLKMLRYFKQNRSDTQYPAVITKIKPFGILFEIPELLYEGFVHVSCMNGDYFVFNEKTNSLTGEKHGKKYTVGKKISVSIKSINFVNQEIDWSFRVKR